jgi:hypothetical protein
VDRNIIVTDDFPPTRHHPEASSLQSEALRFSEAFSDSSKVRVFSSTCSDLQRQSPATEHFSTVANITTENTPTEELFPQARSPSKIFRAVANINTERNTPKKGVFITPKKENHPSGIDPFEHQPPAKQPSALVHFTPPLNP